MTELDVPVTDGPGIEHEPTAPAAPTPSAPKRRVSRVLVAGLVATTLALGGAAYFEQSASADRDEAVSARREVAMQLHEQRVRTEAAEAGGRRARTDAHAASAEAALFLDMVTPFVSLGDQGLEAQRAVQAIAADPNAVDTYNAAVDQANTVIDEYNAQLDALLDRIDDLRGSLEA